ncbi:MAG: hypothetical protein A2176_14545 [Spirochaetes bacterium RBG_13_51_14]|nr:MAG: hypothetical protein A2176_14545 [Spirochaetes bacterium RBG_13_51_14]
MKKPSTINFAGVNFILLTIIIGIHGLSCTRSIIEQGGWEGIRNNTLRVYARLDIPYDAEMKTFQKRETEQLLEAGRNRAVVIMTSYIQAHVNDISRCVACYESIQEYIKTGTILLRECNEEYCEAFIEYDVKGILNAAGISDAE